MVCAIGIYIFLQTPVFGAHPDAAQIKSFASTRLINNGGRFVSSPLPNTAQFSSINKILVEDFDKDGHLDAVTAGNLYGSEVETPRNDASNGLFLKGDGNGSLDAISNRVSGLLASGDVKDMAVILIGNDYYIAVARNSDYLQFIKINSLPAKDDLIAQSHRQQ